MSGFRLRLWRRLHIAPWLTLNISNGGVSTSLGPRGAHFTIGRRGTRETIGLPGTGLFMTRFTPYPGKFPAPPPGSRYRAAANGNVSLRRIAGIVFLAAAAIAALYLAS
jgi:Protein of unknown function (DUF4236)